MHGHIGETLLTRGMTDKLGYIARWYQLHKYLLHFELFEFGNQYQGTTQASTQRTSDLLQHSNGRDGGSCQKLQPGPLSFSEVSEVATGRRSWFVVVYLSISDFFVRLDLTLSFNV